VAVTKDAVDANGDAYSDMSVSAGSRYKPQSAEVTKLVWTDSGVSDVSGLDAAMSLIITMSGGSSSNVADSTHTHALTYTASGDTITESCTCGHSATAVLSVIEKDSRVYNGTAYEDAELTIDYWNWLGSRDLTIEYANNINAGTATASITYSGATASVNFDIEKATQPAPTGLGVTNETILGKGDGTITGLELTSSRGTSMEYSINGEFYNKVTVVDSLFMPGTYYVRYAEGDNYKASPATIVTIADGAPLTVTVPTEQVGYTLTTSANELSWRGDVALSFSLAEGYSKTDSFAVKVNGETVILDSNGQYIISFVETNSVVTVEGVADITAPEAEITLDTNKWNSFWSGFGFDLFFKETQSVTITAADVNTGSGLDKIYYYLSEEELTLDEVKAITNWTEYKNAFNINPDKEYVIYAKATDKAGNAVYVNSDGIVLDATTPVISQVTNGGTYYGDTTFKADDTYLDNVTVDGEEVVLTDGTYTIVADNAEHTIVATDKAGNTTTYQISVYKIYTVTFKVDGNTHSTVQVNHGANAIMPQIPVKEGYTQVAPAWDKDGKNITEDTTITAVYTINKYSVTFKADGTTVETIEVEHGDAIANGDIPTIPSKTGYTQVAPKWDKENFANITSDMTVNAIYTINKYNVVFKADGATVDTIEVEHGGSITNVPQVPAKVGYHASWDSSAFTNITSDMEVNAVYDIHKYTVTFKVDGAVYKEVIVAHGGAVAEIPAIPTKTGYTQVAPYWDVNDFSNITSNKTVNAVYTINQYTVTFKNGEDTVKVFTVNHGSSINDVPQLPEKTGYHGNWDKTDFTNITSDVTMRFMKSTNIPLNLWQMEKW